VSASVALALGAALLAAAGVAAWGIQRQLQRQP
jgi:hypothetical protein